MLKFRKIYAWAARAGSTILVAEGGIRVRAKAMQNGRDGYKSKQKRNTNHTVHQSWLQIFHQSKFSVKIVILCFGQRQILHVECPLLHLSLKEILNYQTKDIKISTYLVFGQIVFDKNLSIPRGEKNLFFTQSYFISLQYTIPIVFCVVKPLTMVQYCSWLSCFCLYTGYLWGRLLHYLCVSIPHLEREHTTLCLFNW